MLYFKTSVVIETPERYLDPGLNMNKIIFYIIIILAMQEKQVISWKMKGIFTVIQDKNISSHIIKYISYIYVIIYVHLHTGCPKKNRD